MKVLIVEDDLMIADMLEEVLLAHNYCVCGIATTVTEAVALALREKPDLAIVDLRLADGGLALISPPKLPTSAGWEFSTRPAMPRTWC